jgi:ankyrin repeat protein
MYKVVERRRMNKELAELIQKNGPTLLIRDYLRRGADPNHSEHTTPLILASDRPDVIRLLLDNGARVNTVDQNGLTALKSAASKNNVKSMDLLVRAGARVNITSPEKSALYHAIEGNGLDAVKYLLRHGADPYRLYNMISPLHASVFTQNADIVKEMIAATKPRIASHGVGPLNTAIRNGYDNIATLLIRAGVNLNSTSDPEMPLVMASIFGRTQIVRLLLRGGANVNQVDAVYREPPIAHALDHEHFDVACVLIREGGAKIPAVYMERFITHIPREITVAENVLKTMFSAVSDINTSRNKLLKIAIMNNEPAMVKVLMDLGATYNPRDQNIKSWIRDNPNAYRNISNILRKRATGTKRKRT